MSSKNFLRAKLEAGKIAIGTWSLIPSVGVTEVIAQAGVDFIVLDGEHGPLNFETAQNMMIACEVHHVSPVMRISGVNASEMLKALDVGAHCIHVPNIATREEAEECVRLLKYPPIGKRGFSPFTRAGGYGKIDPRIVIQKANRSLLLAVHIEDEVGVQNISNILAVKGIDIVFLGLFDLSKSLGMPGEIEHPRVLKLLQDLTKQIVNAGKCPGTIVMSRVQLHRAIDYGVKYITYSVDTRILGQAYESILAENQAH